MSPTIAIIVLIVGVAVLIVGIYLAHTANQQAQVFRTERDKLDRERESLQAQIREAGKKRAEKPAPAVKAEKPVKADKPKAEKPAGPTQAELDAALTRADKLKQEQDELRLKNHNMTSELKELRAKDKEARGRREAFDPAALVELRLELGEARAEAAQLQDTIAILRQQLSEGARNKRATEPAPEPAPVVEAPAPVERVERAAKTSEGADEAVTELRQRVRELERALDAQARDAARDKAALEDDLRGKLKRTAINVDRQRRRADNNDRAYLITQRELDATRDRVQLMERQLRQALGLSVEERDDEPQDEPARITAPEQPEQEHEEAHEVAIAAAVVTEVIAPKATTAEAAPEAAPEVTPELVAETVPAIAEGATEIAAEPAVETPIETAPAPEQAASAAPQADEAEAAPAPVEVADAAPSADTTPDGDLDDAWSEFDVDKL